MKRLIVALTICFFSYNTIAATGIVHETVSPEQRNTDITQGLFHGDLVMHGFPNDIGKLQFVQAFTDSTTAIGFLQGVLKNRYTRAQFPVPFNYTGGWTNDHKMSYDKLTSVAYGFNPLDQFTDAYFAEQSAFKRRKLLKDYDAIAEQIKSLPDFKFPTTNRFIIPIRISGVGQFDFNSMTKDFAFTSQLQCNDISGVVNFSFGLDQTPLEEISITKGFVPFPNSLASHFKKYKHGCMLTMPLPDENIAEKVDVATSEGKIAIWAVVEYSDSVEFREPIGKVSEIVFSRWNDKPYELTYITSLKPKPNDTTPTLFQYFKSQQIDTPRSKDLSDPNSKKAKTYQQIMASFKKMAGKAFYSLINSRLDYRKRKTSKTYFAINPDSGDVELIFPGVNRSNEPFYSLAQYKFKEIEGVWTAQLSKVVTGGNRNIPSLIIFTTQGDVNDFLVHISLYCGDKFECGQTSINTRSGYKYEQFKGWRDLASAPQNW